MAKNLSALLASPEWVRLDRQEDSLMAGLAAELTDPGSTGCEDRDFEDEIQHIAMELNRG